MQNARQRERKWEGEEKTFVGATPLVFHQHARPPKKAWCTTSICHRGSQCLGIGRHCMRYPLLIYK